MDYIIIVWDNGSGGGCGARLVSDSSAIIYLCRHLEPASQAVSKSGEAAARGATSSAPYLELSSHGAVIAFSSASPLPSFGAHQNNWAPAEVLPSLAAAAAPSLCPGAETSRRVIYLSTH